MRKILPYLVLLALYGCNSSTQATSGSFGASGCPENPQGSLKEVEPVSLGDQPVKVSGLLRNGENRGYSFEGRTGQKLSFSTADKICVWVYSPTNDILDSLDLPVDGTYTVQVSTPQGSTSFNLEMGFGSLQASPPPQPTSSPPVALSPDNSPSPTSLPLPSPVPSNSPSASSSSTSSSLSQEQAVKLVQDWLEAKSQMFGPPFNRELASQLTTGVLYEDITKPNGTIDWLRNNNSYYVYRSSRVEKVWSFQNSGSQAFLKANISEDRSLFGPNGEDASKSGRSVGNFLYTFVEENGTWKIYDYREAN